jgi:hypothetical protein
VFQLLAVEVKILFVILGQDKARKALFIINQVNSQCEYSFNSAYDIFDKCIVLILIYGTEIWGPYAQDVIETVHTSFSRFS